MRADPILPDLSGLLAESIHLPDYELGRVLLTIYVHGSAKKAGRHEVDEAFCRSVIRALPDLEANTAKNTAIEKALHKAATGDFALAGRLIREHLTNGAHQFSIANIAVKAREKLQKGPRAGGKAQAEKRAAKAKTDFAETIELYQNYVEQGVAAHEIIGRIARKLNCERTTIGKRLRKAGLR